MEHIIVQAEVQLIANDISEATGLPVTTVGLYRDVDPNLRPPGWKAEAEVLDAFRIEGYNETFFALGVQDLDHYAVVLVNGEGWQIDPTDPKDSYQIETKAKAIEYLNEGVVMPFVMNMASRMTPQRYEELKAIARTKINLKDQTSAD